MARKDNTETALTGELRTIEELAKQAQTPDWVFAGAKVQFGWAAGKELPEAEYRQAIDRFLQSPIGGDKR